MFGQSKVYKVWATVTENDATSQPLIVPCASYVWLSLKSVEVAELR